MSLLERQRHVHSFVVVVCFKLCKIRLCTTAGTEIGGMNKKDECVPRIATVPPCLVAKCGDEIERKMKMASGFLLCAALCSCEQLKESEKMQNKINLGDKHRGSGMAVGQRVEREMHVTARRCQKCESVMNTANGVCGQLKTETASPLVSVCTHCIHKRHFKSTRHHWTAFDPVVTTTIDTSSQPTTRPTSGFPRPDPTDLSIRLHDSLACSILRHPQTRHTTCQQLPHLSRR